MAPSRCSASPAQGAGQRCEAGERRGARWGRRLRAAGACIKKDLPAGEENATRPLGSLRLKTVFAGGTDGTSLRKATAPASVHVCREAQLPHRRVVAVAIEDPRRWLESAKVAPQRPPSGRNAPTSYLRTLLWLPPNSNSRSVRLCPDRARELCTVPLLLAALLTSVLSRPPRPPWNPLVGSRTSPSACRLRQHGALPPQAVHARGVLAGARCPGSSHDLLGATVRRGHVPRGAARLTRLPAQQAAHPRGGAYLEHLYAAAACIVRRCTDAAEAYLLLPTSCLKTAYPPPPRRAHTAQALQRHLPKPPPGATSPLLVLEAASGPGEQPCRRRA